MVKTSQVLIAVGGRYGTLSEIGLALKPGIPVVGIGTWQLSRQGELDTRVIPAFTAEDAVTMAISLVTRE